MFIDYDIDDGLPWHSTISRARDLFPDVVFEQLFEQMLGLCVENDITAGKTHTINSGSVKINASIDSLELKVLEMVI